MSLARRAEVSPGNCQSFPRQFCEFICCLWSDR